MMRVFLNDDGVTWHRPRTVEKLTREQCLELDGDVEFVGDDTGMDKYGVDPEILDPDKTRGV